MKLIFLDIDGVMNNVHRATLMKQQAYRPNGFDPIAVGLLKELIIKTDAKIVISSTWRIGIGKTVEWWNGLLSAYGIDRYSTSEANLVVGLTPVLHEERGYEVLAFLNNFKQEVESFVIFDDDSDFLVGQPLVKVSSQFGLTACHTKLAEEILLKEKKA